VCGGESELQGGMTALLVAILNGHLDCARLLIDAGADKDAAENVRCGPLLFS
jgi:ankyrin repeat protein